MSKNTQKKQVLEYIQTHGSIDTLRAFNEFGITRLSARIYDLRASGHDIATIIKSSKTDDGVKRWAEYRLSRPATGITERLDGVEAVEPSFTSEDTTGKAGGQAELDRMLKALRIYVKCYEQGLLGLFLHDSCGIHLRERDFLRLFPEHSIEYYTDSEGKPARRGYAYYKGQRFFALLDYEPYKEVAE